MVEFTFALEFTFSSQLNKNFISDDLQLNSGDDAEDVNVWDFVSLADYVSIVTNGKTGLLSLKRC